MQIFGNCVQAAAQYKPLKPSFVPSAGADLPADLPAEQSDRFIAWSIRARGEKAFGEPWRELRQEVPVGPRSEGDFTIESTNGTARTGRWDTSVTCYRLRRG